MFFVSVGVHQKIIDVKFGMSRSTPSMSLWKLAGQHKSPIGDVIQWNWPLPGMVKAINFCELHLPEFGSEVQSGKDCRVGSAYVNDTLSDFLHRVLVNMGVLVEVEFPEVLHDPEPLALFLWNAENG